MRPAKKPGHVMALMKLHYSLMMLCALLWSAFSHAGPIADWSAASFRSTALSLQVGGSGTPVTAPALGSGACYWTARSSILVVENSNPGALLEYNLTGGLVSKIDLPGCWDVEGIAMVGDATNVFALALENAAGAPLSGGNEIAVITLTNPPQTSINLSAANRRHFFPSISSRQGHGIEALAWVNTGFFGDSNTGGWFVFATSKPETNGRWALWRIKDSTSGAGISAGTVSGTYSHTPEMVMSFVGPNSVLGGRATDISDMCVQPTGEFLFLSHEGATGSVAGANRGSLVVANKDGRFVDSSPLPRLNTAPPVIGWSRPEGICIIPQISSTPPKVCIVGLPDGVTTNAAIGTDMIHMPVAAWLD